MATSVQIDKRYVQPTEPLHIVGHNWQLQWYQSEIERVIKLWNAGYSLPVIARRLESEPLFIFLLLVDLAERNKIKRRPGFIWGDEHEQILS